MDSVEFHVWWSTITFDDFSHDHRRTQSESTIISNYPQKLTLKSRLLVFKIIKYWRKARAETFSKTVLSNGVIISYEWVLKMEIIQGKMLASFKLFRGIFRARNLNDLSLRSFDFINVGDRYRRVTVMSVTTLVTVMMVTTSPNDLSLILNWPLKSVTKIDLTRI